MFQFLTPLALLGLLAWGVLTGVSFGPAGPDTGRDVAHRLHPGMTLAEAEQVIGGPPGDYRPEDDQDRVFSFGCSVPRTVVWATYRGTITVTDGEEGMPGKPGSRAVRHPDGVVDAVDWAPPAREASAWWRLRSPIAVTAAVLAAVLLALRVSPGTPPASSPPAGPR